MYPYEWACLFYSRSLLVKDLSFLLVPGESSVPIYHRCQKYDTRLKWEFWSKWKTKSHDIV